MEELTINDLFKRWLAWCGGAIISVFIIKIFTDESYDWGRFIGMCAGGIVGISIVIGIKKAIRNSEN